MSLSNYTRNILNIKDENIIFEENDSIAFIIPIFP